MKVYWPEAVMKNGDKQYTYHGMLSIEKALDCIDQWENFWHFDIAHARIKVEDDEDPLAEPVYLHLEKKWVIKED